MKLNIEEYIIPIEDGLASKIYFLAYEKPKSAYEIAFEVYDRYHHSIIGKIHELEVEGYFNSIRVSGKKHPKWLSNVDPLISIIEYKLNNVELKSKQKVKLNSLDKYILKKLLDCSFFRLIVANCYEVEFRGGFNAVEHILQQLDYFMTFFLKTKRYWNVSTGIEKSFSNIKEYKEFINNLKKDYSMGEFTINFTNLLYYDPATKTSKAFSEVLSDKNKTKEVYEIIKSSICFFLIPITLMRKIKGITIIGQLEPLLNSMCEYTEKYSISDIVNNNLLKSIK